MHHWFSTFRILYNPCKDLMGRLNTIIKIPDVLCLHQQVFFILPDPKIKISSHWRLVQKNALTAHLHIIPIKTSKKTTIRKWRRKTSINQKWLNHTVLKDFVITWPPLLRLRVISTLKQIDHLDHIYQNSKVYLALTYSFHCATWVKFRRDIL